MHITVRLFAGQAEHAGVATHQLELPERSTIEHALAALKKQWPALSWPTSTLVAKNREYSQPKEMLMDGDELAIIPPVSGG